jgi:hypothetical protein
MEGEVAKQVAAPAEMRTLNLHRATNRSLRVRMEGWLQYGLGRGMEARSIRVGVLCGRNRLTPTGLLMEGLITCYPSQGRPSGSASDMGIYQRL